MLVEMKSIRERIMDLLTTGTDCAALFMVSGKEPTGDIREDLKNVRAISWLDVAEGVSGNLASTRTFTHKLFLQNYGGYGGKFYQDGARNDELWVQAFPICVYPFNGNGSYDAAILFGFVRNYSGYYPQGSYEYASSNDVVGDAYGPMVADYGTEFDFRKLSTVTFSTNSTYANVTIEYSLDGITWTALVVPNVRTLYVNFRARYIRYTNTTTAIRGRSYVWQVIPKENAFVEETIDKIVLVKSRGQLNISDNLTNSESTNYIGLTLDVGTDVTISETKTGKVAAPYIHSFRIAFASNVVEAQ